MNLLHILSDQHARHVAGCYGDGVVRTPNLDRLAARGVTFDNAYATSPICVPARMSALTARHAFRQDCWTNTDYLASDIPAFGHALGAAGLAPVLVGRLHAMGPDQLHGYARREIGDHSPNWFGIPRHDLGVLDKANDPWREGITKSGPGRSAYEVKDEAVMASAVAVLRELAAAGRPFALTVGLMLPHAPYVAAPDDYARYAGRVPPPRRAPPAEDHPWIGWWRANRGLDTVSQAECMRARAAYYGLVDRLDRMVGELLDALEASGAAGDTLVVYTSDHGDQIGERGLWWKHTFYEESLGVPMILAGPGLPRGERRRQVVNLMDLTQAMLAATGAPLLPDADGRSLWTLAQDGDAPWIDETFAEYCTDDTPAWTGGMAVRQRMIRQGRWKLAYYHGYRPQLFDLAADPGEMLDLGTSPAHAGVRDALLARLLADWDPAAIDARMRRALPGKAVIAEWARRTAPASTYLWPLDPAMNRLDPPPG